VTSLHYSSLLDALFVSYECGLVLFGKPTVASNGTVCIESPVHLDPAKLSANSQNSYAHWTKN